jgi:predicted RNA binding protein YcfA (HicA-like mRNA interferase family)
MPARARDFESALNRKGFQKDRKTDDKVYYFHHDGKKTHIHTKVSHGSGEELRANILGQIKRQLELDSSAQLMRFIDCPLSHADYIAHLKAKQAID